MWEAFEHAGWDELDNLIAIIDVNRLGQTRETMLGWDLDALRRARSRRSAGTRSRSTATTSTRSRPPTPRPRRPTGKPTAIVARTKKGKGVKAVEDQPGKHGKPLDDPEEAIAELGGERDLSRRGGQAASAASRTCFDDRRRRAAALRARRRGGDPQGLRRGARRARRRCRGDVVALDGEVSNSTHSEDFREAHPDRYFEMFIAEQQMVAAAVGMQVRGWMPFASTFAAFLSRAYDFVRMAAISRANLRLSGSHAGVSIGEDGPSQMALEDIAVVPRDPRLDRAAPVATPTRRPSSSAAMADREGISFMRTLRGKTPVRTPPDEDVRDRRQRGSPTRATTWRSSPAASRSTRRVKAAERAGRRRASHARVIDVYSIKPIDAEARPGRGARVRRDRHRRGPLARGRPRRRRARGARRGRRAAAGASSSPSARCRARARPRSCCTTPAIDAEAIAATRPKALVRDRV